jgi:hypothetical protein
MQCCETRVNPIQSRGLMAPEELKNLGFEGEPSSQSK